MGERFPLAAAEAVADLLARELSGACQRLEIAGSIRRRVDAVKDIELVAIPRRDVDLFGSPSTTSPLDVVLAQLAADGRLAPRDVLVHRANGTVERQRRMGKRYKALVTDRLGIPVDLFLPQSDAEWGACLAIRTGPAEFSRMLVTEALRRGLACSGNLLRRDKGSGEVVATPTERDFFAAVGIRWTEPEARL